MKNMFLVVILFFLSFTLVNAQAASESGSALFEADKLFNAGNDLASSDYEAAQTQWSKAAELLEAEVKSGLRNGPLFYNLGNIYFRLGDVGRAILNYRKAECYMPGDANLMRNLSIARRMRKDKVETQESTRVMKTLFFWHYDFSVSTREKIFLVAFTALFLALILRLRYRKLALNWIIALAAVATAVSTVSIALTEYDRARHPEGVILADAVVARTGYSNSYEKSFAEPLHSGTEFKTLSTRADWLEIQLADGSTAWIPQSEAELVKSKLP